MALQCNTNTSWNEHSWFYFVFSVALLIRIFLLLFGVWQDANMSFKYTDVDYEVYTDAARFVTNGESPYLRHTYRYTPILASMLAPNVYFIKEFGKIIFILLDIVAGYLMFRLVLLKQQRCHGNVDYRAALSYTACFLLNPLVFNVSSRGSSDIIIIVMVLAMLFAFENGAISIGSILFGLAVHFRIYPVVYAPALFIYLTDPALVRHQLFSFDMFSKRFSFSWSVARMVVLSFGTFCLLTWGCFKLYGYEFIYETYLYHLVRKDNRHNFSTMFYALYLNYESGFGSLFAFIPQVCLLILIAWRLSRRSITLALTLQTYVFVVFNKVCTAQYFLWYVSLMPVLAAECCSFFSIWSVIIMASLWLITELHWLFWAGQLELMGNHVFVYVWMAGIVFFWANIWIIYQILKSFLPQRLSESHLLQ